MQLIFYSAILIVLFVFLVLKSRNMDLWIISYIRSYFDKSEMDPVVNVYFCLADHFEPYFSRADKRVANNRVDVWCDRYPKVANLHTDSNGNHPKHTYFYPEEEYDEDILNKIKKLCDAGLGDVEIHLHHDNDTAENLEYTLNKFKNILYDKHGLLRKNENGNIVYGFIHGNWALDNSRPDGKWCGIDNELDVLIKTGCVFDMTMPSAPSNTQTKIINSIYYAREDGLPKSHNTGKLAKTGSWVQDDEILMIQGPLCLNWKNRKFGIIPRIESAELSYDAPPSNTRVNLWEKCRVSVLGDSRNIFIKLHTHGLEEQNVRMFFDDNGFDTLWTALERKFKDNNGYHLHYVTAWEMYEKIKSICKG